MLWKAKMPTSNASAPKAIRLKTKLQVRVIRLVFQVLQTQVSMLLDQFLTAISEDEIHQGFRTSGRVAIGQQEEGTAQRILFRRDIRGGRFHDRAVVELDSQ